MRLAAALGDTGRVRQITEALEKLVAHHGTASITGSACLARGVLEQQPEHLLRAVDQYQRAQRPLYEAHAHEHLAILYARAGAAAEARASYGRATTIYTRLDAAWDLTRIETRLRETGVRPGARGPRRRPRTGWEALTDTERTVAAQVAKGLSNPAIAAQMYLSRRTVQSHVSSILAKLDLTSRVEVVAALARDGNAKP